MIKFVSDKLYAKPLKFIRKTSFVKIVFAYLTKAVETEYVQFQ